MEQLSTGVVIACAEPSFTSNCGLLQLSQTHKYNMLPLKCMSPLVRNWVQAILWLRRFLLDHFEVCSI